MDDARAEIVVPAATRYSKYGGGPYVPNFGAYTAYLVAFKREALTPSRTEYLASVCRQMMPPGFGVGQDGRASSLVEGRRVDAEVRLLGQGLATTITIAFARALPVDVRVEPAKRYDGMTRFVGVAKELEVQGKETRLVALGADRRRFVRTLSAEVREELRALSELGELRLSSTALTLELLFAPSPAGFASIAHACLRAAQSVERAFDLPGR